MTDLTVFKGYRVETTAGRVLDLLFRGTTKAGSRLWFTNLDAPYEDVFLRDSQIVAMAPIDAGRLR